MSKPHLHFESKILKYEVQHFNDSPLRPVRITQSAAKMSSLFVMGQTRRAKKSRKTDIRLTELNWSEEFVSPVIYSLYRVSPGGCHQNRFGRRWLGSGRRNSSREMDLTDLAFLFSTLSLY